MQMEYQKLQKQKEEVSRIAKEQQKQKLKNEFEIAAELSSDEILEQLIKDLLFQSAQESIDFVKIQQRHHLSFNSAL